MLSRVSLKLLMVRRASSFCIEVNLTDGSGGGIGNLDFFDAFDILTWESIEKWWCLGNNSNRSAVWIQGRKVL